MKKSMTWTLALGSSVFTVVGCGEPADEELSPLATTSALAARCGSAAQTVEVEDSRGLTRALADARCGDRIVLRARTYDGTFELSRRCPAHDPVVVRAKRPLEARITSPLSLSGSSSVVTGIAFEEGGSLRIRGDDHRIVGNRFRGWGHPAAIQLGKGAGVEIAHNDLARPAAWDAERDPDYPLRMGIRSGYRDTLHERANVHHNHFHDFPPKPRPAEYHSGQDDALEVCATGSTEPARFHVHHNLVERHLQGHGIMDFKCGGNVVERNTIVDSPGGRLDLRNGNGSTVRANWIENAGGIGVHGGHNLVVGNHLVRTGMGISVSGGETAWWDASGGSVPHAFATRLAHNHANRLVVGKRYDSTTLPAVDTTVEEHEGPIDLDFERGTVVRPRSSIPEVAARRLSPIDVGLASFDDPCR